MPEKKTNFAVIGTFEGECADAEVTNNNGLDITRPVWEEVFNSDEYKAGIENNWYIGFLGHPKDPDCMDFEHGCIVMRECHIDDDGKVRGKFDLIDNPVGRIVLSFINAGVKFGISVRGAGDIVNQSVTPGTFVFRGFDLVIFPAYNNAVPEFSKIAASTDAKKRRQYKIVCNTVHDNIKDVTSEEALNIIQSQFAPQSDEYAMVGEQIASLDEEMITVPKAEWDLLQEKVDSLIQLYLDSCGEAIDASQNYRKASSAKKKAVQAAEMKMRRIRRICASQNAQILNQLDRQEAKQRISASANLRLKAKIQDLRKSNLTYMRRVEAATSASSAKDNTISTLNKKLSETVARAENAERRASNLDGTVKSLKQDIAASTKLIGEYQDAFAGMYASALGVKLEDVTVTASTTVSELQSKISGAARAKKPSEVDVADIETDVCESEEDEGIVTL